MSHVQYSKAHTGDILVFEGWSVTSMFVRFGTYSQWSHSGIAVWLKTTEGRKLYCFEAARVRDQPCALRNGETNIGCRLVSMDQVAHFYSTIAVRPVNVKRNDEFYEKLKSFMRQNQGKEVPNRFARLFFINVGLMKRKEEDQHAMLCSELCSQWLEYCGVISKEHVSANPHHLATPQSMTDDIRFPKDAFSSHVHTLKDNAMSNVVKYSIIAIWICSLFLYILASVEDDVNYAKGNRRPGTRWLKKMGISAD